MTRRRPVRRIGQVLLWLAAVWALIAAGSAQAATVTVGSPLTGSFTGTFGGPVTDLNVALPEPGAQVASPVTGTVALAGDRRPHGGPGAARDQARERRRLSGRRK